MGSKTFIAKVNFKYFFKGKTSEDMKMHRHVKKIPLSYHLGNYKDNSPQTLPQVVKLKTLGTLVSYEQFMVYSQDLGNMQI